MLNIRSFNALNTHLKSIAPIRPGRQSGRVFTVKFLLTTYNAVAMQIADLDWKEERKPNNTDTYWFAEFGTCRIHLEGGLRPDEIVAGAVVNLEERVKVVETPVDTHFNFELSITKCDQASTGTVTLEAAQSPNAVAIDEEKGLHVLNGVCLHTPARVDDRPKGERFDRVHAPDRRPDGDNRNRGRKDPTLRW